MLPPSGVTLTPVKRTKTLYINREGGKYMLEFSKKTNLLEQSIYKYTLQDVEEPNLFRDIFNYEEVPKIAFNHRRVPINMPRTYGLPTHLSETASSPWPLIQ